MSITVTTEKRFELDIESFLISDKDTILVKIDFGKFRLY